MNKEHNNDTAIQKQRMYICDAKWWNTIYKLMLCVALTVEDYSKEYKGEYWK